MKTIEHRLYHNIKIEGDCWIWQGAKNNMGYGMIREYETKATSKMRTTHRVSAELNGHDIKGMCVLHSCDNPACINPAHLWIGTMKDNMLDKVTKGRAGLHKYIGEHYPRYSCDTCSNTTPVNKINQHAKRCHGTLIGINTTSPTTRKST